MASGEDFYKLRGKNRWCGPSAISLLTSITTDEAADFIRNQRGRRSNRVMGTWPHECIKVLKRIGYKVKHHTFEESMTWREFWEDGRSVYPKRGNPYDLRSVRGMLQTSDHFVAVWDWNWADNKNPRPMHPDEYKARRSRVRGLIELR